MRRHFFDRWADTTPFRVVLMFAALGVFPVLLVGVCTTVIGGARMFVGGSLPELEAAELAVALLSVGGALGFVGYCRARAGFMNPSRHNVTATLLLLTAGVLAALSVAGIITVAAIDDWLDISGIGPLLVLGALFVLANLLWAFAGIAWMQRLMERYAEKTGRAFDGLPVVLLFTAIALVIAATLKTVTL